MFSFFSADDCSFSFPVFSCYVYTFMMHRVWEAESCQLLDIVKEEIRRDAEIEIATLWMIEYLELINHRPA